MKRPKMFTLLRQKALWLATGRNGVPGFAGFRKDAPRLAAGSFTKLLLMVCLASLSSTLSAAQEDEPNNLLANSNFEEGEIGKLPTGWVIYGYTSKYLKDTVRIDDKVVFEGKKSLKLEILEDIKDPEADDTRIFPHVESANIPVKLGHTYKFSFWAKADRPMVRINMGVASASPKDTYWVKIERAVETDQNWKEYSMLAVIPGEGVANYQPERKTIYARINMETQGIIWIDKTFLAEVNPEQESKKNVTDKYLRDFDAHPPIIKVIHAEEVPVIDGRLDDPVWQKAEKITEWSKSGCPKTQFSLAHDASNFYLAVQCEEPCMEKVNPCGAVSRDGAIWEDNAVEFFINPDDAELHYFQFGVNMDNARLDANCDGHTDMKWNVEWRSATEKKKDSWTVEVALPLASINRKPPENEVWRFNIRRNRFLKGGISQSADWSNIKNNRDMANYGYLVFGKLGEILQSCFESEIKAIDPINKRIEKKELEKFEKGDEARTYMEILKAKEESIRKKLASGEKISPGQEGELYASIRTLGIKWRELDKFVANLVVSQKYIKPISVKSPLTSFKGTEFSRGEGIIKHTYKGKECLGLLEDTKVSPVWFEYLLEAEETGAYILRAHTAVRRPCVMFLDNVPLTDTALSSSSSDPEWYDVGALYLEKGRHVLRFERIRKDIPYVYAFELVKAEDLSPQSTVSIRLIQTVSDLVSGVYKDPHFIPYHPAEIYCLSGDPVRMEIRCINEKKTPATVKIALYSLSEKKDIKIYDVEIPAGETWPLFYTRLTLPDNIKGLFRFGIPQGEKSLGLKSPAMEVLPIDIKSKPSFSEKLELELVDEIDCTKEPDDSHPYAEYNLHQTKVVDGPAGRYRLSDLWYGGGYGYQNLPPNAGSFAYKLNFKDEDLGKPHLIVADVPDDAMRTFAIFYVEECSPVYPPSPGIATGGQFPLSNRMVPLKFFCWPRLNHPVLMFVNWLDGGGAACSRVRIYRVKSGFPPLKIFEGKDRMFGHYFEEIGKIGNYYGSFDPRSIGFKTENIYLRPQIHASPQALIPAIRNYFEYLRYTGRNTLIQTACVYDEEIYPSALLRYRPAAFARMNDIMRVYLDLAQLYGINFIPELAPSEKGGFGRLSNIHELSNKNPVCLVQKDGSVDKGTPFNPIHPEVQEFSCALVQEIMDLYGDHPALKGVSLRVFYPVHTFFSFAGGLNQGYGDYSISLFEKESGIKIPIDNKDPNRFSKRFNWLLENAREEWLNWRCEKMRDLFERLAAIISKKRPDMKLIINLNDPRCVMHPVQSHENHLDSGLPWRDLARGMGIDPFMYKNHKTIVCNQPHRSGLERKIGYMGGSTGAKVQFYDDLNYLPEMIKSCAGGGRIFNVDYFENPTTRHIKPPRYPDFWNTEMYYTVASNINPAGRHILSRFAKSMALGDACFTFEGGVGTFSMGWEEYIQEFAKAYMPLPNKMLEQYPNQSEPVFLWQTDFEGKSYFYLANAAYYDCMVMLEVAKSRRDKLMDLSDGEPVLSNEKRRNIFVYRLPLKGFQLRSFSLPQKARIVSVVTAVPEEEVLRLQEIEKDIDVIISKAQKEMEGSNAFNLALETFRKGKKALAEKRYFEAQCLFENYRLARLYQRFNYPEKLKFVGKGQDYRKLVAP